jgi:hypothetical protein
VIFRSGTSTFRPRSGWGSAIHVAIVTRNDSTGVRSSRPARRQSRNGHFPHESSDLCHILT